jgi:hypothetical protein
MTDEITYFLQRGDVLLKEKFAVKNLNLSSVFCAYDDIVDFFNKLSILNSIPQNYIPVGSVEFINKYADNFGIDLPENISYPECLQKYLKRDLRKGIFLDANDYEFVKPQSTKIFTGAIKKDLKENVVDCEPVWISEPMSFDAEFRYYVVDGKIVGHSRYDDFENDLCADENVVRQMICDYTDQPVGYSIDVGINSDNGETVLIEVNDGWALGLYPWGNMSNESYVDLITKRWKQIIEKKKLVKYQQEILNTLDNVDQFRLCNSRFTYSKSEEYYRKLIKEFIKEETTIKELR